MRAKITTLMLTLFITTFGCGKKKKSNFNDQIGDQPQETRDSIRNQLPEGDENLDPVDRESVEYTPNGVKKIKLTDAIISECETNWNQWLKDFTSTSPFEVINKRWEWKIEEAEVREIIEDEEFEVVLYDTLNIDGDYFNRFDADKFDDLGVMDERDRQMQRNITEIVKNAEDGYLNLIITGYMHAFDSHFLIENELPEKEVIYTTFKVESNTQMKTDAYYDFECARGGCVSREYAKESSGILISPYVKAYLSNHKYDYNYTYAQAFPNAVASPEANVIVVGDWHHIVNNEFADSLPESHCIEALGYKGIRMSFETLDKFAIYYNPGKWYDINAAEKSLDELSGLTALELAKFKKNYPRAYEIMTHSHFFADNIHNVIDKLKSYIDYGYTVEFSGVEN